VSCGHVFAHDVCLLLMFLGLTFHTGCRAFLYNGSRLFRTSGTLLGFCGLGTRLPLLALVFPSVEGPPSPSATLSPESRCPSPSFNSVSSIAPFPTSALKASSSFCTSCPVVAITSSTMRFVSCEFLHEHYSRSAC